MIGFLADACNQRTTRMLPGTVWNLFKNGVKCIKRVLNKGRGKRHQIPKKESK